MAKVTKKDLESMIVVINRALNTNYCLLSDGYGYGLGLPFGEGEFCTSLRRGKQPYSIREMKAYLDAIWHTLDYLNNHK